jgi:hypothetical protein
MRWVAAQATEGCQQCDLLEQQQTNLLQHPSNAFLPQFRVMPWSLSCRGTSACDVQGALLIGRWLQIPDVCIMCCASIARLLASSAVLSAGAGLAWKQCKCRVNLAAGNACLQRSTGNMCCGGHLELVVSSSIKNVSGHADGA